MTRSTSGRGVPIAAAALLLALPASVLAIWQAGLPTPAIAVLVTACAAVQAAGLAAQTRPRAAYAVGAGCVLVLALTPIPGFASGVFLPSALVFLLLQWQLARRAARPWSVAGLVIGLVGAVVATLADAVYNGPIATPILILEGLGLAAATTAAWATGTAARRRQALAAERAEQRVRDALAAERLRIGRDLHDVVSHSLTVMIAQAEAARLVYRRTDRARGASDSASQPTPATPAPSTPVDDAGALTQADQALARVADTGRNALQGLRSMLRVLDADPDGDLRPTPAPRLADLEDLVRDAGSDEYRTSYQVHGTPTPVPPDVELALYRTVQEATTNAIRHLRPPVRIDVTLGWDGPWVTVRIRDDGGTGTVEVNTAGTGLIGMAERVRRAGGDLRIDRARGWTVTATLPVTPAGPAAVEGEQ